MTRKEKTDNL